MKIKDAVDQFILDKELQNLSDATIKTYKSALRKIIEYAGDIDVSDMDTSFVRSYLKSLRENKNPLCKSDDGHYSSKSIQDYFIIIRAFDNWLNQQDMRDHSIMDKLSCPRVEEHLPEVVGDEKLKELFAILEAEADLRVQILFEFFLDTGVRSKELIGLDVDDINIDDGWAKIYGKGRREEIVPFGRNMALRLHRYIYEVRPRFVDNGEKALFVSRLGNRYSRQALYSIIARYLSKAGVDGKVGPHKLRHTFATLYLKNGGDLESLRRIMRHKSVITTQKYIGLTREDLRNAHAKASPLDRLRETY